MAQTAAGDIFAVLMRIVKHSSSLWWSFTFDLCVSPDLPVCRSSRSAALFTGCRRGAGIPGVGAHGRWLWQSEA